MTMDSSNLKPWPPMPDFEHDKSSLSTSSTASDSKPPKLQNKSKELNDKLEQLNVSVAKKEDLKSLASKDDVAQLHAAVNQNNEQVKNQLTDQSSKVVNAVSQARDIGFNDGLGKQVDALSQKYDGLETNINLREAKLDKTTQKYFAKLADLNQVGRYLQSYTVVVNEELVPTLRSLILAVQNGITHHTDEVMKDVYRRIQKETGLTVVQIVQKSLAQEFSKQRHDAQEAALGAKLNAEASKENVNQLLQITNTAKWYLTILAFELIFMMTVVLITPGWWKIVVAVGLIVVIGFVDYELLVEGEKENVG